MTGILAPSNARLIIVMGVSGCGKTTIGKALAEALGIPFIDGDKCHPQANIDKMSGGTPLTDADRWPWFDIIIARMLSASDSHGGVVAACSALKRAYRDYLTNQAGEPVLFVHLAGSKQLIAARQANRPGHFMPASLLDSQFATLEPPGSDELALSLSVSQTPDVLVGELTAALTSQDAR